MHIIVYYQSTMTCLAVLIMDLHIPKSRTFYIYLKLANFQPKKVNVDYKVLL